jgi:hypothetical protein
MFKRFISAIAAMLLVISPALAKGGFSSGGSFSRSSSFSSSSYSQPSYSSYSSAPRYSSTPAAPRYTSPATSRYTSTPSRYTSGSTYAARPTYAGGYTRPYGGGYTQPTVQNHYYNNSFGHPLGSPWFWMWAMDRHQPQTVVVGGAQQAPMVQGGDPSMYAPQVVDNGPGFFMTIFWGIFNLLVLITLVVLLIWAYRKARNWYRNRR